ncbi:uncharacterized protein PGTG_01976 [Puccinia graminis f. sp. tritici CRL 75-36-700-3]|uniref:Uncharacterized protein n=1 Tax=Puccinia graminis f. sp. tritici (strain CRL 75-36-700-3 / race SCCL) TaxID=418459 RepID=E3JTA4_PUCGT|nr:uncharacterized protein PGTG_01976 [Puccinia graminis f. sp. tritici CRL 75-36-700-3]EFP75383.1 hypothetical protein PGTG_01976 [Puccinia graminis f. sp. tritici CRL 75-36-700-3]
MKKSNSFLPSFHLKGLEQLLEGPHLPTHQLAILNYKKALNSEAGWGTAATELAAYSWIMLATISTAAAKPNIAVQTRFSSSTRAAKHSNLLGTHLSAAIPIPNTG